MKRQNGSTAVFSWVHTEAEWLPALRRGVRFNSIRMIKLSDASDKPTDFTIILRLIIAT